MFESVLPVGPVLGRTVQTQPRSYPPAAVALQKRAAIWSCAVHGWAHAAQAVATWPLVREFARASVEAMPLPFVLVYVDQAVSDTPGDSRWFRYPHLTLPLGAPLHQAARGAKFMLRDQRVKISM